MWKHSAPQHVHLPRQKQQPLPPLPLMLASATSCPPSPQRWLPWTQGKRAASVPNRRTTAAKVLRTHHSPRLCPYAGGRCSSSNRNSNRSKSRETHSSSRRGVRQQRQKNTCCCTPNTVEVRSCSCLSLSLPLSHLSLSLSLSLIYLYLSLSLSISTSISTSLSFSCFLPLSLSLTLSVCECISVCVYMCPTQLQTKTLLHRGFDLTQCVLCACALTLSKSYTHALCFSYTSEAPALSL